MSQVRLTMVPALLQVILLSFPAVCWIYGAGFIFSAFVSVIFWGHHAQVLPFLLLGTCCCMPHSWGPQSCPVLSWTVLTGHACCTEVFVLGQTRLGLPCALLKTLLCADALGDHPQEGCCGASCLHTGEPCSWTSQNGPFLSSCRVAGGVAFSHAWQHNTSIGQAHAAHFVHLAFTASAPVVHGLAPPGPQGCRMVVALLLADV